MSKQPVLDIDTPTAAIPAPQDEAAIASYLQLHPEFFERHETLLTRLQLPHRRGSAAISLVERQVLALRENTQSLEGRLRDLIAVARDNDILVQKIHRLARQLIKARTAPALLAAIETSLREDFGASQWLLLLAPAKPTALTTIDSRHLRIVSADAATLKMFDTLFESARPRCGQIRDSQRDFLFGEGTVEVGSAALLPLNQELGFGLLAIASPDEQRFHPTMSTEFLARIGELIGDAVAAV